MRIRPVSFVLALAAMSAAAISCGKIATSPAYMASPEYQTRDTLEASLFKADNAVLSGEDIDKILSTKVKINPKGRVVIMRIGERTQFSTWSQEFAAADRKIVEDFVGKLRTSKHLGDVSVLPALLTPQEMTVPRLREAAARMQADALLVYRTTTRNYQKYRIFNPDEVKAYSTVEAVMIDTRTGIVPFTAVSSEDFSAIKKTGDLTFDETVSKAEQQAMGVALAGVADDLVAFLDGIP